MAKMRITVTLNLDSPLSMNPQSRQEIVENVAEAIEHKINESGITPENEEAHITSFEVNYGDFKASR